MLDNPSISLEALRNHSEVQNIVKSISPDLKERRTGKPQECNVFSNRYIILQDDDRYRFVLDREAQEAIAEDH